MIRSFAITAFALVLAGCARSEDPLATAAFLYAGNDNAVRLVQDFAGLPSDPVTFDSVRVEGDTFVASISYGGGCADHTFGLAIGTVFMESLPVQVGGQLTHDARGDACRALLQKTLRFDLTPLRDTYRINYLQTSGDIILRGNWPDPVTYRF